MTDLKYLDTSKAQFRTTEGGLVSLNLGDQFFPKVDLYLAFPFTFPDQFISVHEPEKEEIGLVRDLKELDQDSQKAIIEELKWRYYTPKIQRIVSYKEEFGHTYWEVDSDHGFHEFVTRGRDRTVRSITERRVLIIDVSGNRYEIEDVTKLDARSRQYLETLL